jgi:UDP-4-amino-4,6-dideoxy-N-acetyl-beta-L-altrosamine transaminase
VDFIPYSRQNISEADVEAVVDALRSTFLTQGPAVPAFEAEFGACHRVAHAIAVANATAGLHLGCLALGVGPGSRVWTSPNSFVASANCARYCGASVDFVDIDPTTRNLSLAALEEKLVAAESKDELPSVLIPVDFGGLPSDLREMRILADRFGFKILQDASHATGGSYLGAPVGHAYADATVFSFHAVKVITTAEGGLVTTQDPGIAKQLQLLRSHGISRDASGFHEAPEGSWVYEQQALGFNYRITDLQAALGLSQLRRLEGLHRRRCELADRYDELLRDLPVIRPARRTDRVSAWHLYVIELDDATVTRTRADVFASLRRAGIGVNVHYIPIHTQPYYRALGFRRGDFPNAETYYRRAVTLPLFPALTEAEQDYVVGQLRDALGAG